MAPFTLPLVAVSLVACGFDLRTRRVPNTLTVATAAVGLLYHLVVGGGHGVLLGLGGLLVGFALFFPLFALGGLGAGDVKLVAALGAWLGPAGALWMVLYAAVAGGVMALAVALARGYLRSAVGNIWALVGFWRVAGIRPLDGMTLDTSKSPRLPYALPITVGLVVALWFR